MKSFDHYNARTVEEALKLLKEYGAGARLIAGGTDLLGTLKDRILPSFPDALVNIKTIPNLDSIEQDSSGMKIGALAKLGKISGSQEVKERYGVLAKASEAVASPEVRNMGTIGGNLCQDVRCWYYRYPHQLGGRILCYRKGIGPCLAIKGDNRYHAIMGAKACFAVTPSDTAVALTALGAKIKTANLKAGRTIPITEFFNPLGNILGKCEIITEIQIPPPPEKSKQTFLKFTLRKPIDFAIASVASVITVKNGICEDIKIALGAVAPIPMRATKAEQAVKGQAINEAIANLAAEAAVEDAKPLSKNAYKIEILRILIRRALLAEGSKLRFSAS